MDDSYLRNVLSSIDTFSSSQNRRGLLFLSSAFASKGERETLAQDCTALAVLHLLRQKDISDSEAVLVVQRMLRTARYDEKRVSQLESCTDTVIPESPAYLELIKKLSFYELLLILSSKMDYSKTRRKVLKHLLEGISEDQIQTHKQDVESTLQLFNSMLIAGALYPSMPISELREIWCGVSSTDKLVQMVIKEVDDTVTRNITQVGESWELNQEIEFEDMRPKTTWCQRKCSCYVKAVLASMAAVMTVILVIFIVMAYLCGPLTEEAGFKLKPQHFETRTSALFWAFEMPFTTARYSGFTIHVRVKQSPIEYAINTILVPCSAKEGPPTTVLQNNSETYTIFDCDPIYPSNRLTHCPINFTDAAADATDDDVIRSASPYVLNGSYFNITLDTEGLEENETVELYVYRNVTVCSTAVFTNELYDPDNIVTGGPIKFSKLGIKSYHLTSNRSGFFCGFWAFNFSATLEYSIRRYIIGYDDTVKPIHHQSYSLTKPSNNTFELVPHSSTVCLLIDITNQYYDLLNLTLVPEKMTIPECFIRSTVHITLCVLILVLLAIVIVLSASLSCLCHCCCCCVNKNIYQDIEYQSLLI